MILNKYYLGPRSAMPILFTPESLNSVREYAQRRMHESTRLRNAHGLRIVDSEYDYKINFLGVLGEWAVANALGLKYVFTVNTFQAPDIVMPDGRALQVKTSDKAKHLIVRPNAADSETYVFCKATIQSVPVDEITEASAVGIGWLTAYEARLMADSEPSFWMAPQNRPEAIFIPQEYLRSFNDLWTTQGLQPTEYNQFMI